MTDVCPGCGSLVAPEQLALGRCRVCGHDLSGAGVLGPEAGRTRSGSVLLDEERTVPQVLPSGPVDAAAERTLTPAMPVAPGPVELPGVHDFGAPLDFAGVGAPPPEAPRPAAVPANGRPSRPPFVGPAPSGAAVDDWEPHLETDLVATVTPGKQLAIGVVVALAVGLALFLLFRLGVKLYRQGHAGRTAAHIQELVRAPTRYAHVHAGSWAPQPGRVWGQKTRPPVPRARRRGVDSASRDALARGLLFPAV